MLDPKELKQKFTDKLALSGFDLSDARKLHLVPHSHDECKALNLPANAAGFIIPYFTLTGAKSKFFRYRYLEDTRQGFERMTGKKPLRYGQTSNTVNEIYFPPYIDWKRWVAKKEPLIITEGELKAACATKMGIPTIGLGGVWCFMSKRHNIPLLPEFEKLDLSGRTIIICYDSDAISNADVVNAEAALSKKLLDKGAMVKIVRLPNVLDNGKTGLDDYLMAKGADKFLELALEAEDYEMSKELHALNGEVVYIRNPGIVYSYEHKIKMRPSDFTAHAFANRWHYEKVTTAKGEKLEKKKTANVWLEWQQRAELAGITYSPGEPLITENRELNTWPGWAVEPKRGNIEPWKALLAHVFRGEHPTVLKWFEQWAAAPVQNPGLKLHSSVLVWGVTQGSGKTTVGQTLMLLYGENGQELKDADLENPRNEWAEHKQFILGDDLTGQDNRKHANRLKTLISQKSMRIDVKYIPSYSIPDCINYFFTSNDPNALFLDDGDRRNFIHRAFEEKLSESFRKEFFQWRDHDGGLAALFYHLLHVDLKGFDPKADAMYTSSKTEMTVVSKSDLGGWVNRLKEDPDGILREHVKGDLATAEELMAVYDPEGNKRATANGLARELIRAHFFIPGTGHNPLRTAQGYRRAYAVRNKDKWKLATSKDAVEHYDEHHPPLPKKKF